MLTASVILGCSNGAPAVRPSKTPEGGPAQPTSSSVLGAAGCHPASPVTRYSSFLPQVEGTGHGAILWGLLMFGHALTLPARVGDQEKIVWRMTGAGPLTLAAIGPDGKAHGLAWGPDAHAGSNWNKPGGEWGAGYIFTEPGCWDLRAIRGSATADVWLRVVK
jgi:hypothetical protein